MLIQIELERAVDAEDEEIGDSLTTKVDKPKNLRKATYSL